MTPRVPISGCIIRKTLTIAIIIINGMNAEEKSPKCSRFDSSQLAR